jgi:hypothetical protein
VEQELQSFLSSIIIYHEFIMREGASYKIRGKAEVVDRMAQERNKHKEQPNTVENGPVSMGQKSKKKTTSCNPTACALVRVSKNYCLSLKAYDWPIV